MNPPGGSYPGYPSVLSPAPPPSTSSASYYPASTTSHASAYSPHTSSNHLPPLPPALPDHARPYVSQPVYSHAQLSSAGGSGNRIVLKGSFASLPSTQPSPAPQSPYPPPSSFQPQYQPAAAPEYGSTWPQEHQHQSPSGQHWTPDPDDMSGSRPRRTSSRPSQPTQHYTASAYEPQKPAPEPPQSHYSTRRSSARASSRAATVNYAEAGYGDDGDYAEDGAGAAGEGYREDQGGYGGIEPQNGENGAGGGEEEPQNGGRPKKKRPTIVDSDTEDDEDAAGEEDPSNGAEPRHAAVAEGHVEEEGIRPRRAAATRIKIADDTDDDDDEADVYQIRRPMLAVKTASGRQTRRPVHYDESPDEEEEKPRSGGRLTRGGRSKSGSGYRGEGIEHDEEWEAAQDDDEEGEYGVRTRGGRSTRSSNRDRRDSSSRSLRSRDQANRPATRQTRNSRKAQDTSYEQREDEEYSTPDTDDDDLDLNDDDDDDLFPGGGPAPRRNLRQKKKVDYFAPLSLEAPAASRKDKKKQMRRRNEDGNPFAGLPANMTGAQWAELYPDGGQPSDSSDDDVPNLGSPSKSALFTGKGAAGGGGMLASGGGLEFGAGAPNNLGKVNNAAALADTDPLGVPSSISFDSVGGLGSHIQQLKEMVSLPLLYPEVFERFAITPPRGVLFHGPPGTGKTLLARALAASCSTDGRKISFFMRKGADCLSKWVGEAERQLRLLFEEAKNCQPSIIFFDEIDGLAPVRSSKQEQIHASIVSTLLALMDGMDGRGQVIVIGATNRPDAIDPALRRPGRFDREFYFPLPNVDARKKILGIHTKGWNPPLEDSFMDELADLTKGYGGADLRALCTEAALNAVQRTYPQIYKTNDRLLIKPETIEVTARDFVISQKNLIPSSHRSTSTSAAALPQQLVPLLAESLDHAKEALARVLPEVKKPNILEEAEFVDEGGGFEKEKMLQAYETLRVFRPRLLLLGEPGAGQGYVGSAVLHHLEGFHVQTLDLATLVSDSTRTMEAACVQLFVEAKRHKPSILFIPSLLTWCTSVGETVRSTIKGLLDGLDPSDPILLLAVVDGSIKDVAADVRAWFGFVKGNRVTMGKPRAEQREAFFADVLAGIARPPNEFPDAMPRRKRVLEKLPIAPPPPPREPTAAEIAQQEANDQRLLEYLKWKLGPVLNELKKRYKRFTRNLYNDWRDDDLEWRRTQLERNETVTGLGTQPYHNVDLDQMHSDLYKGFYHTPEDFLTDVLRIQANAEVNKIMEQDAEAPIKAGQMVNHAKVMLDQTFDASFRSECAKMAERMRAKEKDQPRKERKGKGRDLPEEGIVAHAKQAAVAGGLLKVRPPPGQEEGEDDDAVIVDGEPSHKRAREGGEGGAMDENGGEDGHGPAKRARENGEVDADVPPIAQHANGGPTDANGASSRFHDLLNPTASSSLASFNNASDAIFSPSSIPKIPGVAAAPVAPPMPVGAAPSGSPDKAATPADPSFLSGPVASASTSNPFLFPLPSPSRARDGPMDHEGSRQGTPTPLAGLSSERPPNGDAPNPTSAPSPEKARSPTPMEATPPPLPEFVLPRDAFDAFSALLREGTASLNVDQLEQLRAACFDSVWRGKSEWDRSRLLDEVSELAKEFVEEVQSL
ncbi:hypothetical protein JCM10212_002301 [Sporobolomyces blumeae]